MSVRDVVKGLCDKTKCFFDVYTKEFMDKKLGDMEIETIENDKGTAIKFPDGTMFCKKQVTFKNVSFSNTQGNLYFCQILQLGSTAETFLEAPEVLMNVSKGWALIVGAKNATENSFGTTQLFRGDKEAQEEICIDLFAMGRWK